MARDQREKDQALESPKFGTSAKFAGPGRGGGDWAGPGPTGASRAGTNRAEQEPTEPGPGSGPSTTGSGKAARPRLGPGTSSGMGSLPLETLLISVFIGKS